jgi:3-deoxy-D-manno-octulosonic acid kinase
MVLSWPQTGKETFVSGNVSYLDSGDRQSLFLSYLTDRFTERWFDIEYWGGRATPIGRCGRGAAWFVGEPGERWVLRQYYRGGLPGRLCRSLYCFAGLTRVRAFHEFNLLQRLYSMGLPVPQPIAAHCVNVGKLLYRAFILVRRIEQARTLDDFVEASDSQVWYEAGRCIRRFHDAGVYHADLNCTNILVSPEGIYLIDFDRGRLRTASTQDRWWKRQNLSRLRRSLEKRLADVAPRVRQQHWEILLSGYAEQVPEPRRAAQ